ncbi:MAG: glycosyltransferase [Gemmataceae bacterium]|nr:glycosyltransferase [Gemmataceae bacterium]MDW8265848.1 glycosyltransferase family 2 protein [Gemmataceae bacterium]
MKASALAVLLVYGVIVTFWKVLHVLLFFYKPKRYFLGRRTTPRVGSDGPRISILLAAKDEAGNIGDCMRSVLAARYTNFELIVIDDRSQDGTAAEAEAAAAGDPRVRFLRVDAMPVGWTGKMNAIRQGLTRATGEVLLLIDADSRHHPDTLGTAVAYLERKRVALLSLLPRLEHRCLFSKLVQPMIGALTMFWKPLPWVNSRKRKWLAFGWGGFLMVRRAVLEQVGGLEAVRDRFAADIALVHRVKQAGHRIRILHGPELVSTFLYADRSAIIQGWARLLRITADQRRGLLLTTILALWLLCLTAYPAIVMGLIELFRCLGRGYGLSEVFAGQARELPLFLGLGGVTHLICQLTLLGRFYRISGTHPVYVLGHLPAVVVTCYVLALAYLRTFSGQMSWRGTSYQLTSTGGAGGSR